jgi:hypothetical protein
MSKTSTLEAGVTHEARSLSHMQSCSWTKRFWSSAGGAAKRAPPPAGYRPSGAQLAEGAHPPHDLCRLRNGNLRSQDRALATGAAMMVDRLYHSSALLLPDGRVMTAGSNPARKVNELRIELYQPPYLFQGPRLKWSPRQGTLFLWGRAHRHISTPGNIEKMVLIRPMSTTHCLSTEQRLVELPILSCSDMNLSVNIPANPNLIPPGYSCSSPWLAVPSVAKFIRLG